MKTLWPTIPLAAALILTGCAQSSEQAADSADDSSTISVVAAFYPLAYAAEQVGGDAVTVTSLTPPGAEPHDLELSATQVASIAEADAVIYIPGFQPAVDEAIAQQAPDRAIDALEGLTVLEGHSHDEHGDEKHSEEEAVPDPHVWLNPVNMTVIGDALATRFNEISADPSFAANASTFAGAMTALDQEYRAALETCDIRTMVVSHEAFGYLANAYDLDQVGISGLTPESEPSPARLAEVADVVQRNGVTTIYYETLVDPKVAQTLADETGVTTAVLDPIEGLADGSSDTYTSIMQANLATLVSGQGCTTAP